MIAIKADKCIGALPCDDPDLGGESTVNAKGNGLIVGVLWP